MAIESSLCDARCLLVPPTEVLIVSDKIKFAQIVKNTACYVSNITSEINSGNLLSKQIRLQLDSFWNLKKFGKRDLKRLIIDQVEGEAYQVEDAYDEQHVSAMTEYIRGFQPENKSEAPLTNIMDKTLLTTTIYPSTENEHLDNAAVNRRSTKDWNHIISTQVYEKMKKPKQIPKHQSSAQVSENIDQELVDKGTFSLIITEEVEETQSPSSKAYHKNHVINSIRNPIVFRRYKEKTVRQSWNADIVNNQESMKDLLLGSEIEGKQTKDTCSANHEVSLEQKPTRRIVARVSLKKKNKKFPLSLISEEISLEQNIETSKVEESVDEGTLSSNCTLDKTNPIQESSISLTGTLSDATAEFKNPSDKSNVALNRFIKIEGETSLNYSSKENHFNPDDMPNTIKGVLENIHDETFSLSDGTLPHLTDPINTEVLSETAEKSAGDSIDTLVRDYLGSQLKPIIRRSYFGSLSTPSFHVDDEKPKDEELRSPMSPNLFKFRMLSLRLKRNRNEDIYHSEERKYLDLNANESFHFNPKDITNDLATSNNVDSEIGISDDLRTKKNSSVISEAVVIKDTGPEHLTKRKCNQTIVNEEFRELTNKSADTRATVIENYSKDNCFEETNPPNLPPNTSNNNGGNCTDRRINLGSDTNQNSMIQHQINDSNITNLQGIAKITDFLYEVRFNDKTDDDGDIVLKTNVNAINCCSQESESLFATSEKLIGSNVKDNAGNGLSNTESIIPCNMQQQFELSSISKFELDEAEDMKSVVKEPISPVHNKKQTIQQLNVFHSKCNNVNNKNGDKYVKNDDAVSQNNSDDIDNLDINPCVDSTESTSGDCEDIHAEDAEYAEYNAINISNNNDNSTDNNNVHYNNNNDNDDNNNDNHNDKDNNNENGNDNDNDNVYDNNNNNNKNSLCNKFHDVNNNDFNNSGYRKQGFVEFDFGMI